MLDRLREDWIDRRIKESREIKREGESDKKKKSVKYVLRHIYRDRIIVCHRCLSFPRSSVF